ncbi:hypothetical protein AB833_20870 [Chromatiales bacterium (ex Bugula neritina AB1)]|nr:hypothetical protein AB833_20870 [Chromatiales bacterium (ex Bugula neritina AB1)]
MTDLNSENAAATRAAGLCSAGIEKFVRWRCDALETIEAAIDADNTIALPKLVKAWMFHGAGDATMAESISDLLLQAESCVAQPRGSNQSREWQLLSALELLRSGRELEGVELLQGIVTREPGDLLVHHLLQEELFWLGQPQRMREVIESAAPVWNETQHGYGNFMSLRACANEEAGCLDMADRCGRTAVEIDPSDVWGAHAVAHVLVMQGRMAKGIDWIEKLSSNWGHANQMRHHLWWHMCLFLLETGQHDRILELLTTEVRNPQSALVKSAPAATIDITNFASLLMRLELYGVDVGDRWQVLAAICADRVHNHGSAFSNMHDMMVLAATGQYNKAAELLDSMRGEFQSRKGSIATAYCRVAIPACEAILAHHNRDYARVIKRLGSVRGELSLVGASHAQRDVFYHMLVHAAGQLGRDDLRRIYLGEIERIGFYDVPDRAAYGGGMQLEL